MSAEIIKRKALLFVDDDVGFLTSIQSLFIIPVSAVNNDHHSTMRVMTLRGPIRSPSQPLGTSKAA